jgi:hypothetical protein
MVPVRRSARPRMGRCSGPVELGDRSCGLGRGSAAAAARYSRLLPTPPPSRLSHRGGRLLGNLAAATSAGPGSDDMTSGNDRVTMLLMVVLAQEDRARVSDYFYLCPGHATSVARNPAAHAHAGHVFSHSHGGTLRRGDVVPEDSHGQVPSKADADPFLNPAGHSDSGYSSVVAT